MAHRYFIRLISFLVLLALHGATSRDARAQDTPAPFPAHPYLVFYHGGSSGEGEARPLIDRAGNLVLCGITASVDFPQLPPGRDFMKNNQSVFVTKFDRDGGVLIYSRRFGSRLTLMDAAIGANDEVVLLTDASSDPAFDSLLTADAADSTRSRYGLVVLDCKGEIVYASYLSTSGVGAFIDLETTATGEIWLLGQTYNASPMTTADALFRTKRGGQDAYLLRLSATDRRIEYATIFGGPGNDMLYDLAVNANAVAIAGYVNGTGYPLTNALQDTLKGYSDIVLTKLTADGRGVLLSTYLGGSAAESIDKYNSYGDALQLDADGRIFMIASTGSSDFPLTHAANMAPAQYSNHVLCTISPQHVLERAILLGSTSILHLTDMEVDACGHAMISGSIYGQGFYSVNALWTSGSSFLSVIDTESGTLRLNTPVPESAAGRNHLCLDGAALHLSGSADSTGIPPTPGRPGPQPVKYNVDAFVAAVSMPMLCERPAIDDSSMRTLALGIDAPDTIQIDIPRQLVKPASFATEVRLRNIAAADSTGMLRLRTRMEGGIVFAGGEVEEEQLYPPLLPGGELSWRREVLTDFDRIHPREDLYVVAAASTDDPCPVGASHVKHIKVLYTDFTYADLLCEVAAGEPFVLDAARSTLAVENTALHVRVINRSANAAPLRELRLLFSPNSGCTPAAPASGARTIPPLAPYDTLDLTWTVRAETRQFDRRLRAEVALVDTFGYAMRHGATELFVPGAAGTRCMLQAPSELTLQGDGITRFDTLLARLYVENESDTVRFYSGLRLDLAAAPHLRAVETDTLERGGFYIRERFRRVFEWRLVATADVTAQTDEILRAAYVPDADGREHACTIGVRLVPRRLQLDCTLVAPDTLQPGVTPASHDTVSISAVFSNTGDLPQQLAAASLQLPSGVACLDPLRLPLSSLAPGERDSVVWRIEVPRLPRPRTYEISATAQRVDDSEAARCNRVLAVEAERDFYTFSCEHMGHDSLWRDPYYGRLIPNPLQLQYTVTNVGAMSMPACDIGIVLPAPLRLAAGEDSLRHVQALQPGERWVGEWLLVGDDGELRTGPLTVRWQLHFPDSVLELSCVHDIGVAEGAPTGIVITPWLLRFEGERGEATPAPRDVQLWTGGGTEPPWQVTAQPAWIDVAPAAGRGHVRMSVAANTTLLVPGEHVDSVEITPTPLYPGKVMVVYRVGGILGAENPTNPVAMRIGALYPNPVPAGMPLQAELHARESHVRESFALTLTVHDLLGRERFRSEIDGSGEGMPSLRIPTWGLEAGMYLLSVSGAGRRDTRIFVVGR